MNKLIATILSVLVACSAAKADLVAIYQVSLDKLNGLDIMLSDTTRAGVETEPSKCEKQGKRRVVMFSTYRPVRGGSLFASGCWFHKNGRVFIETTAIEDKSPFNVDFAASKFTTQSSFVGWDAYSKAR